MSPKISSFTPPASPSSIHDKKPPPLERLNQASISSFSRINVTNDPKNDSPNLALITKPSQRFVSRFDSDLDSLQKYIRGFIYIYIFFIFQYFDFDSQTVVIRFEFQ